ncbi:MAG: ATP-binding cassette domain-containing protein, partial [Erysipelotrichaceae bacterium]|nr:ATP-binding cassette domain-containing protein [Erysipelotrichaceae bacterium]
NGVSKGTYNNDELTMAQLTNLIIDRDLENDMDEFKTHKDFGGKNALEVRNIVMKHHSKNILDDISFAVKKGEILGVAGVDGNGQVDLVKTIVGLEQVEYSGDVIINGEKVNDKTVKERRNMGMAYIPEDRMVDGISGTLPISDNMVSTYYDRDDVSKGALLDNKAISRISDELIEKFAVKAKNNAVAVGSLSGGNVQKVVVAREHNTIPNLMIAEQPTHGIDIGSAELVHHKLIELRNEGAGVLLVSADLNEVIDISDRIIVMFEGHIAGYFPDANNIDETELGMYMLGVKRQTPEEIGGALND